MKQEDHPVAGAMIATALVSLFLLASSLNSLAAAAELEPVLSPLAFFAGDWDCSGKFDSSGQTIEAHQHFAADLDGAWMIFRHDDQPPFGYHAVSEWGWDTTQKRFVMLSQDSAGGARSFYSSGWDSRQLQWDGDAIGSSSSPSERFSFERLDDRHFKVSYFTLKNNVWSRVDASPCSKL